MDDIARAQQGDQEALGRLIARHEAFVGRLLWRFTRDPNEWESLKQDTFVQMIRSIRGFRAESELEHWLARIATRVGYRHWKVRRRDRRHAPMGHEEAIQNLATRADPSEAARLLHELLDRVDPPERLALTLVHLEGLTLAEAARRAGWSESGMKMRLLRARQRLAQEARDCGIEPGDIA
jgi:RNA polymerase sigma-70 factor (ECF subfamily)